MERDGSKTQDPMSKVQLLYTTWATLLCHWATSIKIHESIQDPIKKHWRLHPVHSEVLFISEIQYGAPSEQVIGNISKCLCKNVTQN